MTLNVAQMRCPMCGARLLSGYKQLDSADDRFERVEVKCRQKHTVRLTVRTMNGDGTDGGAERKKRA